MSFDAQKLMQVTEVFHGEFIAKVSDEAGKKIGIATSDHNQHVVTNKWCRVVADK